MKFNKLVGAFSLSLAVFMAISFGLLIGPAKGETLTGTISGTVYEEGTTKTLGGGITVFAQTYDNSQEYIGTGVITDDDGKYSIVDLPVGTYRVQAQSGDWAQEFYVNSDAGTYNYNEALVTWHLSRLM